MQWIIIDVKIDASTNWLGSMGIFSSLIKLKKLLKILGHLKSLINLQPSVNTILLLTLYLLEKNGTTTCKSILFVTDCKSNAFFCALVN